MNHNQLRHFVSVYKCGSVKEASELLAVSCQGVSKTVKNLEKEMGVELFRRHGNVLVPTKEADALMPRALRILEEFAIIESGGQMKKRLTVYTIDTIFTRLDADFISAFSKASGNTTLKIILSTNSQAIEHLRADECELAIIQAPYNVPGYANDYLFTQPYGLLINRENPLSKKEKIEDRDLDDQAFAGHGSDYYLFDGYMHSLNSKGIFPNLIVETNNENLLYSLALKNTCIAAVSRHYAETHPDERLVYRPLGEEESDRVYLTYKTTRCLSAEAGIFKSMLTSL